MFTVHKISTQLREDIPSTQKNTHYKYTVHIRSKQTSILQKFREYKLKVYSTQKKLEYLCAPYNRS